MPPIPVYFADSDTFRGAECPDWLLGFLQQQILSDEKFFLVSKSHFFWKPGTRRGACL